jgi:hypothetical protein
MNMFQMCLTGLGGGALACALAAGSFVLLSRAGPAPTTFAEGTRLQDFVQDAHIALTDEERAVLRDLAIEDLPAAIVDAEAAYLDANDDTRDAKRRRYELLRDLAAKFAEPRGPRLAQLALAVRAP